MKRSQAYINAGRKRISGNNASYDISCSELTGFIDEATKGISEAYQAIVDAYYMGIEAGARMTERKAR